MEFFEVVAKRRSVRRYTATDVPEEIMQRALDTALLAPNSSNLQTWKFYWVKSPEKKNELIQACLSQGAARTAKELIVAVASPSLWKKTSKDLLAQPVVGNPAKQIKIYYEKLVPITYGYNFLAPLKWMIFNTIGIFKPMMRRPWSGRDIQEVAIKSTALACENFMLAITAQNFSTCPMEGFDEKRIKKILSLRCSDRVVMVISVGEADPKGVWGAQYRSPKEWFIHEV